MAACFHCGLAVPGTGRFCCAGCEAVAGTIFAAGLGRYYETRSAPAATPAAGFAHHEFQGSEAALILERVTCAACLWLIEQTLLRLPGVTRAEVNYATRRAHLAWDAQRIGFQQIIAALRAVGYDATPYDARRQLELERRERRAALWRLFVAAFGAMQVMMYAFPAYVDDIGAEAAQLMRWASLLITTPVLLISCAPFFAGARRQLRQRRIGLDVPIALGLALGFAASAWATLSGSGEVYFDSISMLAFLLLAARYAEGAARRRAMRELDPLLRLGFENKRVVGESIRVAPGERVPADGLVVEGASSADESLLTGESRPVRKGPGDEVLAGSVNLEQPLSVRATRVGEDTRAAAIARLAERGAASRPPLVDAAEQVARHLTFVIIATALGAAWYWGNPWVAVAVLVVACPCALALSAPVLLTRASGALLRHGVLLTRARALGALERVTDVVLDKTGTLTSGRIALAAVRPLGSLDEQACLRLAASLEAGSRHPIAAAFAGPDAGTAQQVSHEAGQGIEGRIAGRRFRIGSEPFCRALAGALPPLPVTARTRVFLAHDSGWLAAFEVEDELRAQARPLIDRLTAAGCRVHLASGDAASAVAAVARRLGIREAHGGLSPEAKFAYVERLQRAGGVVAMVGDGLNDAPVLARADVSFAMGAGADAAQLRADLVLMNDELERIVDSMELAHRAMHLVRQNLAWALAYNVLALPLAAMGLVGPWEAALAMGASSAAVLLNALRPLEPQNAWKASTFSSPSRSPSYS
jgi:Cu2+-exporting ATPase